MSATVLSFFRPAPTTSGDWSQQELAEFYRVEAASIQAGLRLTLDRGVTDEGDPWLVFCREDGEVFLHFARIDGSYVIVSDMVGEPLVGPDFRALLAELVTRNPSVLPVNRLGHSGPGPRTGAQILMHPAALLAAIVATTCLLSSMNEAVAGEMKSAPLLTAPPGNESETHHGAAALPAFDERHVIDEDAARSRITEQRALAVSTSVVMACIASVLDQSTAHHAHPTPVKPTQVESLALTTPAASSVIRVASDEARSLDHSQDRAGWADAQGSHGSSVVLASAHQPSLPRESAIMLSTPNAGLVASGLEGVALFAKVGPGGGSTPSQALWPSTDIARLAALHARDASTTAMKGGASPAPAAASSGSSLESGTGSDGGPAPASTGDADQPRDSARPAASLDKTLAASAGPGAGAGSSTGTTGVAPSPVVSVTDSSAKAAAAGSHDLGTSTAAQTKAAAIVLSIEAALGTAAQVVSDAAKSQGVLSPLQSLGSLSAKTVSLFLHNLIGDTLFVGAVEGATGSSTAQDLFHAGTAGAATGSAATAVKIGQDLSTIDLATVAASAVPTATATVPATKTAVATPTIPASGDHITADATGGQTLSTAHSPSDSAQGTTAANPASLPAMASGTGGQAGSTAPVQGASSGQTDPGHAAVAAGSTTTAPPSGTVAAATLPTGGSGIGTKATDGLSTVDATAQTEAQHVAALQTVSALVSSTNTITKAISISLVTSKMMLDTAQLQIIDAFMNSTPNVKIVATENTLEIYDPTALSNPNIHAMSWDLGGGSTIKVVGLSDAHPL